jgi:hypothetical protein
MTRPQLILPRADSACGKLFFSDRRTAEGHRIALDVWNRATGRNREGYRLAVYRCRRCWGFHIGQRSIDSLPVRKAPRPDDGAAPESHDHEEESLRIRRVSRHDGDR